MKKSGFNQQPKAFEAEETLLSKIEAQLQDEEAAVRSDGDQRLERQEPQKSDFQTDPKDIPEQSDLSAQVAGLKGNFFAMNVERESLLEDDSHFSIEQNVLNDLLTELRDPGQSKKAQKKHPKSTNSTSGEEHADVFQQLEDLYAKKKEIKDLEDELNRDIDKLSQERDSFEKEPFDSTQERELLENNQAQVEEVREAFAENEPLSSDSDRESILIEDLRAELAEIFGIPVSSLKQREQKFESLIDEEIEEEDETKIKNEPELISSPSKRRIREESEVMRASIDSFRELANLSARAAVAKSNLIRERVILKVLSALSALSWIITIGLFSVEFWSTSNCRLIATVLGSCSLVLSARMLLSCFAIKQFEAASQLLPDASQTESSEENMA